jgi:hypothetical protein
MIQTRPANLCVILVLLGGAAAAQQIVRSSADPDGTGGTYTVVFGGPPRGSLVVIVPSLPYSIERTAKQCGRSLMETISPPTCLSPCIGTPWVIPIGVMCNDQPLVSVDEIWACSSLEPVVVRANRLDFMGTKTIQGLVNVSHAEPDAALFPGSARLPDRG